MYMVWVCRVLHGVTSFLEYRHAYECIKKALVWCSIRGMYIHIHMYIDVWTYVSKYVFMYNLIVLCQLLYMRIEFMVYVF